MQRLETTKDIVAAQVAHLQSDRPLPFEPAIEAGWGGFAGGIDHCRVACGGWGMYIVDRGVSTSDGWKSGSVLLVVRVKDRKGKPPVPKHFYWDQKCSRL